MNIYKGILDPSDVNQSIRDNIKDFILKTLRDENASWYLNVITIWKDGNPVSIWSGDRYSEGSGEVYLRHRAGEGIPHWVPGVLSAVVQLFRMENDQEIKDALMAIGARMAAGIFRSIQSNLAQSYDGTQLVHLAVNVNDNRLAGEYPGTEDEPAPVWRESITGHPVNIDEPGWTAFTLGA